MFYSVNHVIVCEDVFSLLTQIAPSCAWEGHCGGCNHLSKKVIFSGAFSSDEVFISENNASLCCFVLWEEGKFCGPSAPMYWELLNTAHSGTKLCAEWAFAVSGEFMFLLIVCYATLYWMPVSVRFAIENSCLKPGIRSNIMDKFKCRFILLSTKYICRQKCLNF